MVVIERHAAFDDRVRVQRGAVLLVVLMAVLLLTALGTALVLTTTTETMIAANFSNGQEAVYAAEAGLERSIEDLATVPAWNTILGGLTRSAFVDGAPSGDRVLPGGGTLNLSQLQNIANCGKPAGCSVAEMNAVTGTRPWGADNPRWQLYAHAPLNDVIPTGTVNAPFYVVVLVADDTAESDGDPLSDSNGTLTVRAEAFGPGNAHRVIEATVARTDAADFERGYVGQRGQDEYNRGARRGALQTPGKEIGRLEFSVATGGRMVR